MLLNHMVEQSPSLDKVFRALGDSTRLAMIESLVQGERTISELADPAEMTLAGASKHIGVLEEAGLLIREKKGRQRVCRLRPEALFAAKEWVRLYTEFWNARLNALDQALQEDDDD